MPTAVEEMRARLAELEELEAAAADADDDDLESGGNGGTGGGAPTSDSKSIKSIRAALRRKDADFKAAEKRAEELEAALSEATAFKVAYEEGQRKTAVVGIFKALELREKMANLYTGEPDEASVKQWAIDNDLLSADGEDLSSDGGDGFEPSRHVDGTPPAGPRKLGHEDAMALLKTDPEMFDKMYDAGRITLNTEGS